MQLIKLFGLAWCTLLCTNVMAQPPTVAPAYPNAPNAATDINGYVFYIDSTTINSTPQSVAFAASPTNSIGSQSITVPSASGVHRLFVKVKTTDGTSSIYNVGVFYKEANDTQYPNAPASATNITKYTFYLDSTGATPQAVSFTAALTNTIASQSIDLSAAGSGVHKLLAKVETTNGVSSIINVGSFYKEANDTQYPNAPSSPIDITKYTFYIDSATASSVPQPVIFSAAATNSIPAQSINLSTTPSGVHKLLAKVETTTGISSIYNFGNFYKEAPETQYQNAPVAPALINKYEFFVDSVKNNAVPLPFTAALTNTTNNTSVSISGTQPGVHRLFAKVYNTNGDYSIINVGQFTMNLTFSYPNAPTGLQNLQNLEYYIDTDPGYGNGTAITVPGTNTLESFSSLSITIPNTFPLGTHYFHVRSKQNPWSIDNAVPFDVAVTTPVTWQYIKAQLLNEQTQVSWATATEINTDKFEIEWSRDGLYFAKIGTVNAAGNSTVVRTYNLIHPNPTTGFNYYRIKQLDLNGAFKYSVIVKVLYNKNIKQTLIAPNPVMDVVNIVEPKPVFIKHVEVYDAKGMLVLQKTINAEEQVYSLQANKLAQGNYALKVYYKNELKTYTFMKK